MTTEGTVLLMSKEGTEQEDSGQDAQYVQEIFIGDFEGDKIEQIERFAVEV